MGKKQALFYLFFGVCTTGIGLGCFAFLERICKMPALSANVLSWILAVSFAYVTNRIWVFPTENSGKDACKEAISFFVGRLTTLLLEEGILLVFVVWLGWHAVTVKLAAQTVVFISNYGISKWIVFRK